MQETGTVCSVPDLYPELAVLSRALDQATRMLEEVTSARMTRCDAVPGLGDG